MKFTLITLASSLLITSSAFAAQPKKQKGPDPVERLKKMEGHWKGSAKFHMGKQSSNLVISMKCEIASGGRALACRSTVEGIPGAGVAEETDLFGYDAGHNTYHWFSVTSAGETHDHVAQVKDKGPLVFAHSGLMDGQPMQEVIKLDLSADGKRIKLRNDGIVGGQPAWEFEGSITRQASKISRR